MTMSTSRRETDVEAWVHGLELDRSDVVDGARLARIGAALDAVERAERDLVDAVAAAHAGGDSWAAIGVVLGTSRQAAHRKYALAVDAPRRD
ncbi:hypothetical protein [Curtobacterium sp. Leaf261]|uniref:hypothetical protein n=1 Tax=Curtobacterium sp. Leaf261 TaxID=1736311 RepID=UPI000B188614|nr:hypothetical protein [Curtobacterium sp. Leaf261]